MTDLQVEKRLKSLEEKLAKQNPREGLELIRQLRSQLDKNQSWYLAKTYFWENLCYKHLGESKLAEKASKKGIKIFRELGDFVESSKILRDLGLAYEYSNNYEKALEKLTESFNELRSNDVIDASGITLSKIGQIYLKKGDLDRAYYFCDLGYRICREGYNGFFLMTAILPLSLVFYKVGEYQRSLEILDEAEEILKKLNKENNFINDRRSGEIALRKSLNFSGLKNAKKSFKYFKIFAKYCLTVGTIERAIFTGSEELAELFIYFKDEGESEKVVKYLSKELEIDVKQLSSEIQISL